MNRSIAKILTIVISVAVVLPVGQNFSSDPVDSFPLSYYPMFSKERGKTIDMIYIAGFDRNGQESRLPISLAGSGGFHQIRKQINRTHERGELGTLCQKVANRIAVSKRSEFAKLTRVEFVNGTFHIKEFFSGKKDPLSKHTLVGKPIARR